ncbi:MAG: acyl-CoA dehydrogenase family protein [Saprospiraceae bacterium]|nr:acyl-CoA dehydrogenase family protein [Saprospiraceae bacterium]
MALILNEEQQMLKTSAKEFLTQKAPVSALRFLRDTKDSVGYDPSLWTEMVEMGWAALTIPEDFGGMGFGYVGLGQILEESGRTLTASPIVSNLLLGASAIEIGGSESQKQALLPALAEGQLTLTLAFEEHNAHRPFAIESSVEEKEGQLVLNGSKRFVIDGHVAQKLIVSAMYQGEIALFLVDASAKGVKIDRKLMMDSRNAANIQFDGVAVEAADQVGDRSSLEQVLDIARIGMAAEMLGTMQEAFERTIAYLKERVQFKVPIGSFQALQHRAAMMFSEIEVCKSMVLKALQALDAQDDKVPVLASMVKAKVGEVIQIVTNEAIQMFGGIGMTDDEEIGFFLKRARVAQQTFGDYNYHLDRFASLNGF